MDDASLDDFLDDGSDDRDAGSDEEATDGAEGAPADGTDRTDPQTDESADDGAANDEATGGTDRTAAEPVEEDAPAGADPATEDDTAGGDDAGPAGDPEAVAPAESTFAWSSEPVACAACGEAVQRRWRDDGDLVCRACKSW